MLKLLLRHARIATTPKAKRDDARFAYELLYGEPPTPEALERLRALGVFQGDIDLVEVMRRIRAATASGHHESPFLIRMGQDSVVWVACDGFRIAVDRADVSVGRLLMQAGVWEPHLTALFRRTLKPGMSVVDIGANIGYYSLLAASLVGSAGRVIAFEPNSENNRLILLSRGENGFEQIHLVPAALSDRLGHAAFSVAMGSNGGLRHPLENALYSPQCQIVPTLRLDDVVSGPVDFIKMDIEGAEPLALAGANRVLDERRPVVSSEFSPFMITAISGSDPMSFLQIFLSRGYDGFLLDKESHAETPIIDAAAFLAGYGSEHRIEDLVFRPRV